MLSAALLVLALQVLAAALLVITVVATARKGQTHRTLARDAARTDAVRPFVVALVSGEQPPWPPGALGAQAERLAVETLRKVRGEARDALAAALEARGSIDRAIRRARRPGALGRARAADLLGLARVERALPDLVRLLGDRSPVVRRVAARAIGTLGLAEGAAPLLAATHRRRALPAGIVAMAIEQIGPSCATTLRSALHDPSATARLVAAQLLGHHEVLASAGDVVGRMEVEPQPVVRATMARSLGAIGSPVAVPALRELVAGWDPPAVRAAAAEALGRIGAVDAVPLLVEALEEGGYEVPHAASRALHDLGIDGRAALVAAVQRGESGAAHAAEALALGVVREVGRR